VELWDSDESDIEVQAALEESLTSKECMYLNSQALCIVHFEQFSLGCMYTYEQFLLLKKRVQNCVFVGPARLQLLCKTQNLRAFPL